MGWSFTWNAFRGKSRETILSELNLKPTSERGYFLDGAKFCCAQLPSGWFLVAQNHSEAWISDRFLERFSLGCETVSLFVEEHVMVSQAVAWTEGKKLWLIDHFSDRGIYNLEISGEPPSCFPSIKSHYFSSQDREGGKNAGVDYIFSIPVAVAKELTGFTHERDVPGLADNAFENLELLNENALRLEDPKKSWFKRWFG